MIPSERSHLYISAVTHPGMSGKNNEDNYAVTAHRVSQKDSTPSVLAVLADGVGGHMAGEVAAEIATETISQIVLESDASNPLETLKAAITQANHKVASQSTVDDGQLGMGSTCACVWVIDNRFYTASLGDSRIYFIREGQIQQVTTDHTWVQEAIEHGILTPEQARNHPRSHVIRRYLGSKKPVEPDFRLRLSPEESDEESIAHQGMDLQPGDRVLLCSDGLTDLVEDHEILKALQNYPKETALQTLIDLANKRGGHDNITIITLEMPPTKETEKNQVGSPAKPRKKTRWQIYMAIGIFLIVTIISAIILYFYMAHMPPKSTPTITPTATAVVEMIVSEEETNTPQVSEPTITPSPFPTSTSILATYTPWPTHTPIP